MKLIPRQRRPIRSVRERTRDDDPVEYADRRTAVTMDKRGGMARDERQAGGLVLGLGSRFRLPQRGIDPEDSGPGPAGRAYRVSVISKNINQRLLGLPLLRLEVDVKQRGQAYRLLEPCTTRFRMRSAPDDLPEPELRFQLAGRGGPKVLVEDDT
jgi:hypothetical protein